MGRTRRWAAASLGVSACSALLATAGANTANAGTSALPPTWHVHDCAHAPCTLPHAPVAFFPSVLGESLAVYLTDPARCPDATDKAFLGGGQPPTASGVQPNQPLREGVCMTSTTVIHLKSISPNRPVATGWTSLGTSGGYTTYYRLTTR